MRTTPTKQWTRRVGAVLAAVTMTVGFTACGGGGDDGRGSGGNAYSAPKGASTETISVQAQNFSFTPSKLTADPGIATIKLTAKAGIHDFVFDGAYSGFALEADGGGGSQSKKIDLKPGKYTFYCSVDGHEAAGMTGELDVS
jgi:plastocyanin